jgi:hypothetical protein
VRIIQAINQFRAEEREAYGSLPVEAPPEDMPGDEFQVA